jgi:hypothetical protein
MRNGKALFEWIMMGIAIACIIILVQHFSAKQDSSPVNTLQLKHFSAKNALPFSEPSENKVTVSLQSKSFHTTTYVEVTRQGLCLFEILFSEDKVKSDFYKVDVPIPLTKLFQTLFKAIISPNAP